MSDSESVCVVEGSLNPLDSSPFKEILAEPPAFLRAARVSVVNSPSSQIFPQESTIKK
jgi:hypothetical protein